jgi:hypothetical protein
MNQAVGLVSLDKTPMAMTLQGKPYDCVGVITSLVAQRPSQEVQECGST